MSTTMFHKTLSELLMPWADPQWLDEYMNTSMLPMPSRSWMLKKILEYEAAYKMKTEDVYKLYRYDSFELGRTGISRSELNDWIKLWSLYR